MSHIEAAVLSATVWGETGLAGWLCRATTREEGLAGLISLLTSQWQYEEAVLR